MKTQKVLLSLFSLFLFLSPAMSQVTSNFQKSDLSNKITSQNLSSGLEQRFNKSIQITEGHKSPYLGALFSGLIPGTGEFYAKRYLKSAIFLGVEAGLWVAYSIFQNKGNTQTDKFQMFADQNWDVYKYAGWLIREGFPGSSNIIITSDKEELRREINICEGMSFSHQLPPYGEQQYYELIGKYQNFVAGWADANLDVLNRNTYESYKTTMFINYSYDRQKANDYFYRGSTSLALIIANHILSAADGAWSVSMFNKGITVRTGFHFENVYSYTGEKKIIPEANIGVTF